MKKYIGTKVIMAEPMTMTEAQKVLGRELSWEDNCVELKSE